jgi:hypothetical protein
MKIFKYLFLKSFGVFSSLGILLMCFLVFMFSDAIIKGSVFLCMCAVQGFELGLHFEPLHQPFFCDGLFNRQSC